MSIYFCGCVPQSFCLSVVRAFQFLLWWDGVVVFFSRSSSHFPLQPDASTRLIRTHSIVKMKMKERKKEKNSYDTQRWNTLWWNRCKIHKWFLIRSRLLLSNKKHSLIHFRMRTYENIHINYIDILFSFFFLSLSLAN